MHDSVDVGKVIHKEHQDLYSVLTCLRLMAKKGRESAEPVNTVAMHQAFTYMEKVLNTYHHPKENAYLFPVLREHCPDLGDVIDELEEQHRQLPKYLDKVRETLALYEPPPHQSHNDFCDAVEDCCSREIGHMRLEESKVLSRARESLSAEDWAGIDAAFEDNPDPLFGKEREAEYNELFHELLDTMPAPYGYGEPS